MIFCKLVQVRHHGECLEIICINRKSRRSRACMNDSDVAIIILMLDRVIDWNDEDSWQHKQ